MVKLPSSQRSWNLGCPLQLEVGRYTQKGYPILTKLPQLNKDLQLELGLSSCADAESGKLKLWERRKMKMMRMSDMISSTEDGKKSLRYREAKAHGIS